MPPLLANFIYDRVCKLKCEKFLTRPNASAAITNKFVAIE